MEEKLPIIRLNRLSWLIAIIIGIIFYIIISHAGTQPHIYSLTLFAVSSILAFGYANVGFMIILKRKYKINTRKFRIYRYLLTYPGCIIIYLILWFVFAYLANYTCSVLNVDFFFALVGSSIVINTVILLLHDSVLLYEYKLRTELELSRLNAANAEAMNLALKQQIQPHFLFNALNTLNALYHSDTRIADTYLVHMANFLRASIFHHASSISSLEDELKLLYDYLAMQRIRFGAALDCTVSLTDDTIKFYSLPSFSLQPLLENAIKHNNFTQEEPLKVNISQVNDWLVISNNIQKKKIKVASINYGLANLAERYRLWSGDDIIIKEDQNSFSVSIKLLKNEHSNH